MKEAELTALTIRSETDYFGYLTHTIKADVTALLQYVRDLQGQVADLWDESRAYELGRMAERGVILAAIKKIRQMRNYTWDDPYNGDPAQIALDLVACKLTGPVRPLPHPEQLAAENAVLRELAEAVRALVSAMKAPRTLAGLPWQQVRETLERLDALDRAKNNS